MNKKEKTFELIKIASSIAAIFHDFGKSNILFQEKINPSIKTENYEPYRHEWLSLLFFEYFVYNKKDIEWLEDLKNKQYSSMELCLDKIKNKIEINKSKICELSPLAQLIALLIVSHHKLPISPYHYQQKTNNKLKPELKFHDKWLLNHFQSDWNSPYCLVNDDENKIMKNLTFEENSLPCKSKKWQEKASNIAKGSLIFLKEQNIDIKDYINDNIYIYQLSKLSLILGDHFYSQYGKNKEHQDKNYKMYANSRKNEDNKYILNQKLDEHLIGVSNESYDISQSLFGFEDSLPNLNNNDFLLSCISKKEKELYKKYSWQNKAQILSKNIAKSTIKNGFFGLNIASTGKGKTIANAKIMSTIGQEVGQIRFNVALALRSLTLQTGLEYIKSFQLKKEDYSILIGSTESQQLFEYFNKEGSESINLENDFYSYLEKTNKKNHNLTKWIKDKEAIENFVYPPINVSTIDHLISASEGIRGGKGIASTLRLMSSDLIIDEPDSLNVEDYPALSRLVYFTGLLGRRIILSSATMSPSLIVTLYDAYKEGWTQYAKANIENWDGNICCAWFDEFNTSNESNSLFSNPNDFLREHNKFVKNRNEKLKENIKNIGDILEIEDGANVSPELKIAKSIIKSIPELHRNNNTKNKENTKTVSFGVVRIANIDPLIKIMKETMSFDAPFIEVEDDCAIYFCSYHSRYPLAIRSNLENVLDKTLNRKNEYDIFNPDHYIGKMINKNNYKHNIIIVFSSPISETGRDHDYDWGIIEVSSIRSNTQMSGRILRHRDKRVDHPNILFLNQNYNSLCGRELCFTMPGYERKYGNNGKGFIIKNGSKTCDIIDPEDYKKISSKAITENPNKHNTGNYYSDLNLLEHNSITEILLAGENNAMLYWNKKFASKAFWSGEFQSQQPFRKSKKDETYCFYLNENDNKFYWKFVNKKTNEVGELSNIKIFNDIENKNLKIGKNIYFWNETPCVEVYKNLKSELNLSIKDVNVKFGEVKLPKKNNETYYYSNNFGLYKK